MQTWVYHRSMLQATHVSAAACAPDLAVHVADPAGHPVLPGVRYTDDFESSFGGLAPAPPPAPRGAVVAMPSPLGSSDPVEYPVLRGQGAVGVVPAEWGVGGAGFEDGDDGEDDGGSGSGVGAEEVCEEAGLGQGREGRRRGRGRGSAGTRGRGRGRGRARADALQSGAEGGLSCNDDSAVTYYHARTAQPFTASELKEVQQWAQLKAADAEPEGGAPPDSDDEQDDEDDMVGAAGKGQRCLAVWLRTVGTISYTHTVHVSE